jgi:CTP:molybdopterin cytidylyltransferase MocA
MDLSPEEGLRGLLKSNQNDLELVEINSGAILKDIDTRNDYDEILKNI